MEKNFILFVDDEESAMDSYVLDLKYEYEGKYLVSIENNIDKAYMFVKKNHKSIKLIVLDLMMPVGKCLTKKYKDVNPVRCGLYFKRMIREISKDIHIVILTNLSLDSLLHEKIEVDNKCLLLEKQDYLPFELTKEISKFL